MQATGANLDGLAAELRDQLAQVRAEVESLLASGWQGQAASGFGRGWQVWDAGAQECLSALTEMAGLLGVTGRDYAGSEDASTATVRDSGPAL